jgi:hypothetical protein
MNASLPSLQGKWKCNPKDHLHKEETGLWERGGQETALARKAQASLSFLTLSSKPL